MNDIEKYYVVLGIKFGASLEEVREAYRDSVKAWHPDRFPNESERYKKKAEENTKEINEAYEKIKLFLSSSNKKYTKRADTRTKEDTTRTDTHQEHERKEEDSKQKTNRTTPIFINNGDGTITYTRNSLMLSQDANTPSIEIDPEIWQDTFWSKFHTLLGKKHCSTTGLKTWQMARKHIACLNKANYLGHNDWRLPTEEELKSLVNEVDEDDRIDIYKWFERIGFTMRDFRFWAFSETYDATLGIWCPYYRYVWPVRVVMNTHRTTHREHNWKNEETKRFINNGDKTITDTRTGLIWSQDASTPSIDLDAWNDNVWSKLGKKLKGLYTTGAKTWQKAKDYIACLNKANYLGHNDWRLPTEEELKNLMKSYAGDDLLNYNSHKSWLERIGFTVPLAGDWWSSTPTLSPLSGAVGSSVNVYGGRGIDNKTSRHYIWPVRGGQ